MLVAGEISKNLGLLAASELELLREAVRLCGHCRAASNLDVDADHQRTSRTTRKASAGQINGCCSNGSARRGSLTAKKSVRRYCVIRYALVLSRL